jgi:membrane associated rhomboid family serine protease
MLNSAPITKNLILINVVMLLGTMAFKSAYNIDLTDVLGMHYYASDNFHPYQLFTYMFMHGGFTHLFFNMFALYMFGKVLEQVWGSKRFLFFYIFTALGAVVVHSLVSYFMFSRIESALTAFNLAPSPGDFEILIKKYFPEYFQQIYDKLLVAWTADPANVSYIAQANLAVHDMIKYQMDIPMVGASGAIFGVLLAFGMLFPNTELMLLFPPIPIKAKYFVIGYGLIELTMGVYNPGSNIAHFAHLGGMIFGFFLIRYWQKNTKTFY